MLSCRELVEFLMEYCDGELPPEQREYFEKHLACCPPCVAYMKTYQQAICLGKSACQEEEQKPPKMPEELVRAIMAARQAK
ncbi:MAG: zf-HC2 domain-containing protein [Planctomycetia bacterium]|nr:zf-HC2 domain-containing protein [Planctomycetia bacterium]